MNPSIYIRIDQHPVGSQFKFDAQIVIGDDTKGEVAGVLSPKFDVGDEHEPFVTMMQKITTMLLQYRDFRKKATKKDFHLLNAQGEDIV